MMLNVFKNAFGNYNFILDTCEIIIFAIVIYFALVILVSNNAKIFVVFYCLFIVVMGIIFLVDPYLHTSSFLFVPAFLSVIVILVFSSEVKRYLWTASFSSKADEKQLKAITNDEIGGYVSNIIRAIQNFSKNNTGALIVLSNGNLSKQILDSGVNLNADISTQLIESVFYPKSALHDGAMIINGHRIEAAGCFLPITQRANLSKNLGSRHRAGIGVTETADVVSIVVSEETGIISIVKHGNIENYADYDKLQKTLNDYYWKDLSVITTRRSKNA